MDVPLLEAMYAEVPVITSNISSMPEVVGEAGILVDPTDISSIRDALIRLYEDKELQQELIEKGKLQRERYSWERVSEVVYRALEEAALGT